MLCWAEPAIALANALEAASAPGEGANATACCAASGKGVEAGDALGPRETVMSMLSSAGPLNMPANILLLVRRSAGLDTNARSVHGGNPSEMEFGQLKLRDSNNVIVAIAKAQDDSEDCDRAIETCDVH